MSYEKLGFVKGQTLKADHLNHMEEGISNAGSCGFEYYTGEVELDAPNRFIFTGLDSETIKNYYEMEIGVMLHDNSKPCPFFKYTFVNPSGLNQKDAVENDQNSYYPSAIIYSNSKGLVFSLSGSALSGAVSMNNPSILYVRLYKKV